MWTQVLKKINSRTLLLQEGLDPILRCAEGGLGLGCICAPNVGKIPVRSPYSGSTNSHTFFGQGKSFELGFGVLAVLALFLLVARHRLFRSGSKKAEVLEMPI